MENFTLISIAVPCYEMHGKGDVFLRRLLNSVHSQSYKNVEVIVSDHSQTSIIEDECNLWKDKLAVKYIKNDIGRGNSSINVNTAIKNCDGEIIIPLFQDDFLFNNNYLKKLVEEFAPSNSKWGASACNHTDENETRFFYNHPATYSGFDVTGINTIGAPSVVYFKKECEELFDENLIWLMDCEFYYRLYNKFGLPFIFDDIMVTVRMWENNVTNTLATKAVRKKEAQYVIAKHGL
jgi:glycosyltransferase involved in cell wall biosynthesis